MKLDIHMKLHEIIQIRYKMFLYEVEPSYYISRLKQIYSNYLLEYDISNFDISVYYLRYILY
jgi:hypothetical protein